MSDFVKSDLAINAPNVDLTISSLGPGRYENPLGLEHYIDDLDDRILFHSSLRLARRSLVDHVATAAKPGAEPCGPCGHDVHMPAGHGAGHEEGHGLPVFQAAGPRKSLFFKPGQGLTAGIVTCGGICPGLNDVIRSLTMGLWFSYGVRRILGFRYGYKGLVPDESNPPLMLDPEVVDHIHQHGGTILGSSRGPQPVEVMADNLQALGVNMLFTVGGDGTHRGANQLVAELKRRQAPIAVVGIPKTIDNDIGLMDRTFGFETAVSHAREVVRAAHVESKGMPYGIGLVKLMGRYSGFVAAYSALANSEVNLVLIPESPFRLDGENGVLEFLHQRLLERKHAVVVVAEGAGQDLPGFGDTGSEPRLDLSGNVKLLDVGLFLQEQFKSYFKSVGVPISMKYFDPSYLIRSTPATADDSVFCVQLAQHAVHAAMAGKTGMIVGSWNGQFVHIPISAVVNSTKNIDPAGPFWQSVLLATGQPKSFM